MGQELWPCGRCCWCLHAFLIKSCREMDKFRLCTCEVQSGTVGGPLQWETERKGAGLVIPEVVGLPVCHPQSPPTPPPKSPLTAFPIICLSVALLLPRQKRDEGIYCRLDKKEQKSCETNKDSLYFRQTLSDDAKSFMTRYILYLRKVFFICELHNTFGCV